MGAEEAAKISESLMTNTTLTELNLYCDDKIIKNNVWSNKCKMNEI